MIVKSSATDSDHARIPLQTLEPPEVEPDVVHEGQSRTTDAPRPPGVDTLPFHAYTDNESCQTGTVAGCLRPTRDTSGALETGDVPWAWKNSEPHYETPATAVE